MDRSKLDILDFVTLIKPFEDLKVGMFGKIRGIHDNLFKIQFMDEYGNIVIKHNVPKNYVKWSENIEINLEYFECPIDLSDICTGEIYTNIMFVNNDETLKKLNLKIGRMYASYCEYESHDQPCWFNDEQYEKDEEELKSLITQLVDRLNEINDGSYVVVNYLTYFTKNIDRTKIKDNLYVEVK